MFYVCHPLIEHFVKINIKEKELIFVVHHQSINDKQNEIDKD